MADKFEDNEPGKRAEADVTRHTRRADRWAWVVLVGTALMSVALAVTRLASD